MPCIAGRARPLVLRGTLTTFRRRCGKPSCRCTTGEPHESSRRPLEARPEDIGLLTAAHEPPLWVT